MEVNHMLTDPIEPDSDEPQLSKPRSPPLHSIPPSPRHDVRDKIPRGSSDGLTTTAADSGFFESPPPFPNPSDDIFASSSDTDRPPRSISRSKPRPVPKLESLFGGERHKQPSRRVYLSSSDSDSRVEGKRAKKQKTLGVYAIEPQWPPVRASRKQKSADLQQRVSGANGTAPSYSERSREQNQTLGFPGHTGSSMSSLPSTNLVPPSTNLVQPSRKGKEQEMDLRIHPSINHHRGMEPDEMLKKKKRKRKNRYLPNPLVSHTLRR
ncbi:hypothetical protein C8R42DRAFT_178993 [Lentinula raphanica]|nr:hypothetical protein C8R42DRAFT_178993 [Lentinula raphanica]